MAKLFCDDLLPRSPVKKSAAGMGEYELIPRLRLLRVAGVEPLDLVLRRLSQRWPRSVSTV